MAQPGKASSRSLSCFCRIQPDSLNRNGLLDDAPHSVNLWSQVARLIQDGPDRRVVYVNSVPHPTVKMISAPSLSQCPPLDGYCLSAVGKNPSSPFPGILRKMS